ncbi:hypothetical protein HMPREF1141_2759 [Clostridium sp. MSTE9]|nr:hypothetical protein HMPREF1141_2759 [Clostridium sp. MSTE9]
MQRKIVLQEIALVCIVTESTGQVFTDNTVDFSRLHIMYHALKIGAVMVRSCSSVIYIVVNNDVFPLKKFLHILRENFLLICYTETFIISIILRKTDIECNIPNNFL